MAGKLGKSQQKVLKVLRDKPACSTSDKISKKTGIPIELIHNILYNARKQGYVKKTGKTGTKFVNAITNKGRRLLSGKPFKKRKTRMVKKVKSTMPASHPVLTASDGSLGSIVLLKQGSKSNCEKCGRNLLASVMFRKGSTTISLYCLCGEVRPVQPNELLDWLEIALNAPTGVKVKQ